MSTTELLAGDVGVRIELGPLATGDLDATTVDGLELLVRDPAGVTSDWGGVLFSVSTAACSIRHVTNGVLNALPGRYAGRVFLKVGGSIVLATKEFNFEAKAARVAFPT